MVELVKKIFQKMFPFVANVQDNNKIKNKLNLLSSVKTDLEYMKEYNALSIDQLKDFYNDTFEIKNKLEDKAKINIVGLTISISLILGLSNLITKINESFGMNWITIIVIILSFFSFGYMVAAGILSMAVLVKENSVYKIWPEDLLSGEEKLKEVYALNTEMNINKNIIRNNYIYTSYECIINSLICLSIIFLLSLLPINDHQLNHLAYSANESDRYINYKIIYTENSTIECHKINKDTLEEMVTDIISRSNDYIKTVEDASEIKIADKKHKIYIKFIKLGNRIIILNVQEGIHIQDN
ncbi:uncharacterized protein Thert_02131 [Thermoanaerobacterium thermosaccharolyticum]|uniref:Uncharacterized protein n=2 Tax=Thermoanaerobacterium TaxID=28895 RepID=A0A223I019_THETR|nr:hypothetical protein [Thermoanaerobacterium thermosaccharolyticum]AST58070.1 uncharacterized protein Thert_02131 [Thermoanaerobacterium thermosaccharolyticum]